MTLARLLRADGYLVKEYETGEELLAAASSLTSGCILLDINMPGRDGFAIRRILAEQLIALPIVMMTGSGDLTVLAFKAGAADFMEKPFGRSELLSVLEHVATDFDNG